ncbi:2-isopropylmalate synthase/homocitrate synthase family protein [Actinobacteria bacterium OK074]|nr:2-isopropylmalate synthase/homocitrate synthase family protein [Actinobacteria bacterium OK074]
MNAVPDDSFHVFDTTLRDGAQSEGINLTVNDKLAIARLLDDFGVGFIEGGWPGANPRDTEFFQRARTEIDFRHATLVAFGSTRRAGLRVEEDPQVAALLAAGTDTVHLVAKSHDRHVTLALRTSLEENLRMVSDTVAHVRGHGKRVFLACEHFFDGYADNPEYALDVVRTAHEAGAEVVVLCDTNGGMLPDRIHAVVSEVRGATGARLGVHTQDDTGCAVANTLAAVDAGATHVQCTANGYGERTGNANLFQVVAALELKRDRRVLPEGGLARMTRLAHRIAEIVDLAPPTHDPYVGTSAFAHKGGLHAAAVKVDPGLYQHIDPTLVGNGMRMLVSDMAGRASIELKAEQLGVSLAGDREMSARLIARVKERELQGYAYESADASLELLIREETEGPGRRPFEAEYWRVVVENRAGGRPVNEAIVELRVGERRTVTVAKAASPVATLQLAVQRGLGQAYPGLRELRVVDHKVRTLDGVGSAGSVARVLLTMTDGIKRWTTVGVAEDVVAASWRALDDAYVYGLLHSGATAGVAVAKEAEAVH